MKQLFRQLAVALPGQNEAAGGESQGVENIVINSTPEPAAGILFFSGAQPFVMLVRTNVLLL